MTGSAFRFRLERVRAVRERNEDLAKQELASAISRRTLSEQELHDAETRLEHAHSEQRAASDGAVAMGADELRSRQAYLERVEARRAENMRNLSMREAEVADRDARLATAASEHKMLTRLRERHLGEHQRDAAHREQRSLDEIATQRFGGRTA
jgi:flagellar FliJ protein